MKNSENLKIIVASLNEVVKEHLNNVTLLGCLVREVIKTDSFNNIFWAARKEIDLIKDKDLKNQFIDLHNQATVLKRFIGEFEVFENLQKRLANWNPKDFFGDHEVIGEIIWNSNWFHEEIYPKYQGFEIASDAWKSLSKAYIDFANSVRPIKEALENKKNSWKNCFVNR